MLSISKIGGCKTLKCSMVTGTEHICGVVESPNLLPACVLQLITVARQEKGRLKEG